MQTVAIVWRRAPKWLSRVLLAAAIIAIAVAVGPFDNTHALPCEAGGHWIADGVCD